MIILQILDIYQVSGFAKETKWALKNPANIFDIIAGLGASHRNRTGNLSITSRVLCQVEPGRQEGFYKKIPKQYFIS
jgi:hypothetical protein